MDAGTGGIPFIVVCASSATNALGRALAMAIVARRLGSVRVWALNDGAIWPPASQFDVDVEIFSRSEMLAALNEQWRSRPDTVVWVSKGLPPLGVLVQEVSRTTGFRIILDLDDADDALAEGFCEQSILNRVRLNPLRRMHPSRIRKSQLLVRKYAAGLTFSSPALRDRFGWLGLESAIVSHARPLSNGRGGRAHSDGGVLRVGMLGTIRRHKGGEVFRNLLLHERGFVGVVFEDSVPDMYGLDDRLITLPRELALDEVYSNVDVSLVPIDLTYSGAALQLPAKIFDSLRAGVPVLVSRSSAVESSVGGLVDYLAADASSQVLANRLRQTVADSDSSKLIRAFNEEFSDVALALRFEDLLSRISSKNS